MSIGSSFNDMTSSVFSPLDFMKIYFFKNVYLEPILYMCACVGEEKSQLIIISCVKAAHHGLFQTWQKVKALYTNYDLCLSTHFLVYGHPAMTLVYQCDVVPSRGIDMVLLYNMWVISRLVESIQLH